MEVSKSSITGDIPVMIKIKAWIAKVVSNTKIGAAFVINNSILIG